MAVPAPFPAAYSIRERSVIRSWIWRSVDRRAVGSGSDSTWDEATATVISPEAGPIGLLADILQWVHVHVVYL